MDFLFLVLGCREERARKTSRHSLNPGSLQSSTFPQFFYYWNNENVLAYMRFLKKYLGKFLLWNSIPFQITSVKYRLCSPAPQKMMSRKMYQKTCEIQHFVALQHNSTGHNCEIKIIQNGKQHGIKLWNANPRCVLKKWIWKLSLQSQEKQEITPLTDLMIYLEDCENLKITQGVMKLRWNWIFCNEPAFGNSSKEAQVSFLWQSFRYTSVSQFPH